MTRLRLGGWAVVVSLGLGACADPAPAPATPPTAGGTAASSASTSAPAQAAASAAGHPPVAAQTDTPRPASGMSPLDAHRAALRRRAFKHQVPVALPADFPPALRALTPQNPEFAGTAEAPAFKVVAWERHEGLDKVRLAPGHRMDALHFATLDRGPTLVAGVVARLRAEGWLAPDIEVHSPLTHPRYGELHLLLTEFDEQPTQLDFKLISKTLAQPADFRARLEQAPAWLSALAALPLWGYEYGRHHQHTPRASFTDLERLAFAVQAPDRAALWAEVTAAARKAGYRDVADHPRLLEHGTTTLAITLPDAPPVTPVSAGPGARPQAPPVLPVPPGPGPVVIHHQRPFTVEPALTPRP